MLNWWEIRVGDLAVWRDVKFYFLFSRTGKSKNFVKRGESYGQVMNFSEDSLTFFKCMYNAHFYPGCFTK